MSNVRVPRRITDLGGVEWLFWRKSGSDKIPLSYRLPKWKGCVNLTPHMIETMFTRDGRPEPQSNIVMQGRYECAAASLAMLLGENIFHVKRAMGRNGWRNDDAGASDKIMIEAARMFNRDLIKVYGSEINSKIGPCSVTVRSMNVKGMFHAVTWNGKEILDPNWGREGRKFWGCEWAPWTMQPRGALVLLNRQLSNAERAEYDEAVRAREEKEVAAIKKAVFAALKEAS